VEERPVSPRLNLANRFYADNDDLLRVNPAHSHGKAYKYVVTNNVNDRPEYKVPSAPVGVPQWAFLQVEYLRKLEKIINYYIDNRQIANGEFGGGLSDDDDFTNMFVGTAFMGIEPEKTLRSLRSMMSAYYDQERDPFYSSFKQPSLPLFTNGLATINTDLLHAYEEGMEAIGQLQLLDYGNPEHINHGMEVAKKVLEDITQFNAAGHRHFKSRFYGGTSMSTEDPWQWSGAHSYHVLHTSYLLAQYNGNPKLKKMIVEVADGLLAHTDENGDVYTDIHFATDKVRGKSGALNTWQVLKAAYDITGDRKYLKAVTEDKIADSRPFNQDSLVARYAERIKDLEAREYINTVGTVWIDRIVAPHTDLQTDRLGGVALWRINNIYPQNWVSWTVNAPATYESLAFFLPKANATNIDVIAYNLDQKPVSANMTMGNVKPGRWRIRQGIDNNNDQQIDLNATERIVDLERGESIKLTFPPRKNSVVKLQLVQSAKTSYSERADIGISKADVRIKNNQVTIRVHNVGAIDAPATALQLRDGNGRLITTVSVPGLKAPLDLVPKWTDVKVNVPKAVDLTTGSVQLDPEKKMVQITRVNDYVKW
jgi:hypothetical protein